MTPTNEDVLTIRSLIDDFLASKAKKKLDSLSDDDDASKRKEITNSYDREHWLDSAAKRVRDLQLATHIAKAIHPSIKKATSLYIHPKQLNDPGFVGTHCLSEAFTHDISVDNAASLDVYAFLSIEHKGQALLELALNKEKIFVEALSDDVNRAQEWTESFANITQSRWGAASHCLAKQIYFPLHDDIYHLLAPLYPTTFTHHIRGIIDEHKFSEDAKTAREARRRNEFSAKGVHNYPNLAIQVLGGSNKQNVSYLNSKRGGKNYLLASLPPNWKSQRIKPPLNIDTVFRWFRRRSHVRHLARQLRHYLSSLPTHRSTLKMRETRSTYTRALCDELLQFAAEFKLLQPGWSDHEDCRIPDAQKYWLDPYRAEFDEDFCSERNRTDWNKEISTEFAAWLNSTLRTDRLRMSDSEYSHWRSVLEQELKLVEEEVRYGA